MKLNICSDHFVCMAMRAMLTSADQLINNKRTMQEYIEWNTNTYILRAIVHNKSHGMPYTCPLQTRRARTHTKNHICWDFPIISAKVCFSLILMCSGSGHLISTISSEYVITWVVLALHNNNIRNTYRIHFRLNKMQLQCVEDDFYAVNCCVVCFGSYISFARLYLIWLKTKS